MTQFAVRLHCYDLSGGMAARMSQAFIGRQLDGVWHTGIVVYGKEFFFSGNVGIVHEVPRHTHFGEPTRIVDMGVTRRTETEFLGWIQQQGNNGFGPNDYNLFSQNCNHFTQAAARFLVGRDIPEDIRNMVDYVLNTPFGQFLQPFLSQLGSIPAPPPSQSATAQTGLLSKKNCLTPEEEEALMIARAMLHGNELLSSGSREGPDATLEALTFLRRTLGNILQHPTEDKYRRLSTVSQSYKTKLLALEGFGVSEILRLCGFRLVEGNWHLADADGSAEVLTIVTKHLGELYDVIMTDASLQSASVTSCRKLSRSAASGDSCPESPKPKTKLNSKTDVSGADLFGAFMHDAGTPLDSVSELMNWSAGGEGTITPALPCRRRVRDAPKDRPRLLICHDMRGGYLPGDYARFSLCDNSSVKREMGNAYSVNYWNLVDVFIYFSHHFVTIPPKEWINDGHRHGVPVLGTLIEEGSRSVCTILENAADGAAFVHKLVELCNVYNFDGYLLNMESNVGLCNVERLLAFVNTLRVELNKNRSPFSCERSVVWYDSVTTMGSLRYQNSLSEENRGFFDVSDFLFTNYVWQQRDLERSRRLAGDRHRDVCAGVDVFGRGVFGGGGYNSHLAVQCAVNEELSVALFAVGWTLELQGMGVRKTFLNSDARMWSNLQHFFFSHRIEYDTLPVWTCFRSPVGNQFFVNGTLVVGNAIGGKNPLHADWCQLSQAHITPCYQFLSERGDGDVWCMLPLKTNGGESGDDAVSVEWTSERVWMGDRSLSFVVPPNATVTVMQWKVELDGRYSADGTLAFLDIAWLREPKEHRQGRQQTRFRKLCVEGIAESSVTELVFDEVDGAGRKGDQVTVVGDWEIVRYPIDESTKWSHVTSVAVANGSADEPWHCTIGGIGLAAPLKGKNTSVLMADPGERLQSGEFDVKRTHDETTRVVEFEVPHTMQLHDNFLLFARIRMMPHSVCIYMGQHVVQPIMSVPLRIPKASAVQELFFHRVSAGN